MRNATRHLTLLILVACGIGTSILGDHNGSWLLARNNGIRVSPLDRTVFTLQSDGNWIQDFVSPEFSGASVGTYTIAADTLTTTGETGRTFTYLFHTTADSLYLNEIIGSGNRLVYARVSGRNAVFNP